jgi:hypothetical protein
MFKKVAILKLLKLYNATLLILLRYPCVRACVRARAPVGDNTAYILSIIRLGFSLRCGKNVLSQTDSWKKTGM